MRRTTFFCPALVSLGLLAISGGALAQTPPLPAPAEPAPAERAALVEPSDEGSTPPALEADRSPLVKVVGAAPSPEANIARAPAAEQPAPAAEPKPPHVQRIRLGLGFRGAAVSSPGYDPYSNDNTLPMASIFGTFTPWPTRPVSVGVTAEWDYGGSNAKARGNPSSLVMHRLALGLESRYMPITRMAFLARVLPAAIHVGGAIDDSYFGNSLEAAAWTWGVDVTGGAAARVGAVGPNENPVVSIWLALDMGYRFAGVTSMRFRPGDLTEEDATRRFGEVPLTKLDLSGFIGRFSVSVEF